jgi:hypothetical protein
MVLLFHLHHLFTSEVAKLVRRQEETDPLPFQVAMMGPEGQAKIRYIGGWAIQKSLEKSRKYAMNHKTCGTADLLWKVKKELTKAQLLQSSTLHPQMLNVVESRQFRERGLLHISDEAYAFFMSLEQTRVEKINKGRLDCLKANMVQVSIDKVCEDKKLEDELLTALSYQTKSRYRYVK